MADPRNTRPPMSSRYSGNIDEEGTSPSTSSQASQQSEVSEPHNYLDRESPAVQELLRTYFREIHPLWPILHAPTFDPQIAPYVLLRCMILLATWQKGSPDHVELASLVLDELTATLLEFNPRFRRDLKPASIHTLQALLLCIVYACYCSSVEGVMDRAIQFHALLVGICRHLGIFSGPPLGHDTPDSPTTKWLAQEESYRLAFAVLRVDAYLTILTDHPPSVRYQELRIPLPNTLHLWTAGGEDERVIPRQSDTRSATKPAFCFLVRDVLLFDHQRHLSYQLTEAEHHLSLCAMQVGIWEALHDTRTCDSNTNATEPLSTEVIQLWNSHLHRWRASTERDGLDMWNYHTSTRTDDPNFPPLNLFLWHISALSLHSPLRLLKCQACCVNCSIFSEMTTERRRERLRAWAASSDIRIAVWNAAQLCRIAARQSSSNSTSGDLTLNPLVIPGLLRSAIVICSYAYYTRACPACTRGPPVELVDLLAAENGESQRWVEQGQGSAYWSPLSIPLCQCKVMTLARWFREALVRDNNARTTFESFITRLLRNYSESPQGSTEANPE